MTNAEKLTLKKHACHIRMGVIEGTHSAGCGHPGGSLSIADVLSYLYFKELNVDPAQPKMANRDRLVLSKGHAAPALYAALAERGFFPVEELKTLRKIGSRLQGHPNMNSVPGVDMSTGSLGQGISAACGMALGAKHAGSAVNVYAILGDGEVEEGECWEAFMFAAHYGLSNLCVMLDRNHLQIDGTTETVMNSAPLEDKLRAFNFNVVTINGHDFDQIESAHLHHSGYGQGHRRFLYDQFRCMARQGPQRRRVSGGHERAERRLCRAGTGGELRWQT